MSDIINLTPVEVLELLKAHKITLVDVREPAEYMAERIDGALLFPLSTFNPANLPPVDESKPIVFHCGAGVRSGKAVAACYNAGIKHVRHMAGGFGAWKMAELPYLKVDPRSGQLYVA